MSAQPQRLTLSRILEMMLTRGGDRSSVSLTRSPAGETVIEVKVRTGDNDDLETLEQAGARAQAEYERLAGLYPHSGDHHGADVSLTRNAKGETQVAVSLKSSSGAPTVAEVSKLAEVEYDRLRRAYPMLSGATAAAGTVDKGGDRG